MPPLDASIILQGQQPNLLGTLQNVQNYKNSQIENQLLQLRQKSEQGTLTGRTNYGRAIQQNTGPDGDVNWHNSLVSMSKDPENAFYMSDAANQNLGQQKETQGVRSATAGASQAELENARAHLQTGIQLFSGLEGKKGIATASDVDDTLATGIRSGMFNTPESFSQMMAERDKVHDMIGALPKGPDGQPDPQAVDKIVRTEAGNYRQHMQDIAQHPLLVNTGRQQLPYTASATGGLQPQAGAPPITNQLSPGEATAPTTLGVTSQGAPITGTRQQFIKAAQGGQGIVTGQGPGQAAAAGVQGQTSAARASDLITQAQGVPSRKALLETLENKLNNFSPGPQADLAKVAGQLAQEYHLPFSDALAKGTASQEEYAKLATQLAQQQFASLGGTGTDAKLASAVHTSPSEFLSKEGNKGIISILKGNEDALGVKAQMWQKWSQTHPAETYDTFTNAFNQRFDPRVFQSVYQSPQEIAAQVKAMTPAERAAFQKNYNYSVQAGWIPAPK